MQMVRVEKGREGGLVVYVATIQEAEIPVDSSGPRNNMDIHMIMFKYNCA